MKRLAVLAVALVVLACTSVASAAIVPLARAYPWAYQETGVRDGGISVNLVVGHAWDRATIAEDTANGDILAGCRGTGDINVRVWIPRLYGHGFGQATCHDTTAWRVLIPRVPLAEPVEAQVTFLPEPTTEAASWSSLELHGEPNLLA